MLASSHTSAGPSFQVIELGLTLITVALALCFPRAASGFFSNLESWFGKLARKRALSVFVVGATACTLRLLLLPLSPIPQPSAHDAFSFLLAADTFAHGRLTNPTPSMWMHFESFHITMKPTYMSMYFPAQGMIMAAGKVLAGHPWWGVWASCGLMCAAICWMLQGWLPPGWALLGALLAVLRLALFSYWINSYTGAGATAALAGALVLGAVPRIRRHFRMRDFFWMALGMAILATSRPYEGLLVSIPALVAVAWWCFRGSHPRASILIPRIAPAALVLVTTVSFMAYYDYRLYGNVFTPPYKVDRQTYAVVQHFLWQPLQPEPVYRHRIMRDFYAESQEGSELKYFRTETRSAASLLEADTQKLFAAGLFFVGFALVPTLIMLPWAVCDRRIRLLTVTAAIVAAGLALESFFLQHYLAPATTVLYALLLQCMRHLRVRGSSGLFLVRATPALCVVLALLRVFAQPLHFDVSRKRLVTEAAAWYGTVPVGLERARVLDQLQRLPGPQLAIIPYSPGHVFNDWIFNAANIDKSKVIWARQMDPASDRELLNYYKGRKAWLVEPNCNPPRITPFGSHDLAENGKIIASKIMASR